jgi:regulatory protein
VRSRGGTPSSPGGDLEIISLAARRGRGDRTRVYFDGGHQLELASILVEGAGLRPGLVLGEKERERLIREDQPYRARSRALHMLSTRDRSTREVETRLNDNGFEPDVIADTTSWLQDLGYLDDERFAERYATEKLRAGWGPRRISAELARKGIDRETVKLVLDSEGDNAQAVIEGDEVVMALARRRFGGQFATDPDAAERRLAGYLARRGFDWETIARIARTLRSEVAQ